MASTTTDDLYALLGVSQDAPDDQIRQNYKSLAKELHPDRFVGDAAAQQDAEERFSKVSHAYNVLKDRAQRAEYDFERRMVKQGGLDENIEVVEKPVEETGYKREVADRKYKLALQTQAEGDPKKAVEYIKEAIEMCPNVAQYHALLGALYDRRGWHSYARAEIETALRLDPEDLLSQKLHKKLLGEIAKREREDDTLEDGKRPKKKKKKFKAEAHNAKLKGTQAFKRSKRSFWGDLLAKLQQKKEP